MALISFHITSKKSIIYVIYIGIMNVRLYEHKFFPDKGMGLGGSKQISYIIEIYISLLFGFILELISRLISRNMSKRLTISKSKKLNKSQQIDKNKFTKLNDILTEQLFLIFTTLIYFLETYWSYLVYVHFSYSQSTYFVKTLGFFISLIVAYFVLRNPLYRHQYIGFGFIIIGALLCFNKLTKEPYILAFIRRSIMAACLYSYCIFVKFLLNRSKRLTIYSIQGFNGLYGLIFTFILFFILSFIDVIKEEGNCTKFTCFGKKKMFEIQFFYDSLNCWLHYSTYISAILKIITNVSLMYIIQFFGPLQVAIADFGYSLSSTIVELINGNTSGWTLYLSCILVLIGFFIFNENIILRFCGLEQNTKREIEKRVFDNNIDQTVQTMELENIGESDDTFN